MRTGDRHEQDPATWSAAALSAVRDALGSLGEHRVEAVAVDATSGTLTLVDLEGRARAPGLMYDDNRADPQLDRVNRLGAVQWAESGYQRMQRSWALPRLVWLLEHVDGAAGLRLAHQGDVVTRALTGRDGPTDTSSALKTGADAAAVAWPTGVLTELGVPTAMLPDLVLPGSLLGRVGSAASGATGLPAGTPVVAGMTDGCAAQLGAGVVSPGQWNSVLGTTLILKGVTSRRLSDPSGAVYSHRSPTGDWLPGGASSIGAGAVAHEFADDDLAALSRAAARLLPTAVVRYPLTGRGERFPFVAPAARALTMGDADGRVASFAALLQGVALIERLAYDSLGRLGAPAVGAVVLTGGATRNRAWNQLRADVLGRPVLLPENAEPALGMCLLAAAAVQGADGPPDLAATAARMTRIRARLEPDPERTAGYAAPYRRLVDRLEEEGWLPGPLARYARAEIAA